MRRFKKIEVVKNVILGEKSSIEKGAIIGYRPTRKIQNLEVKIGCNAKVRSGSVIYAGTIIGDNLEVGHNVVIREENRIGDNFRVWSNSIVDYGCKIGNNVRIHCNSYIAQFTQIEDDVFIAPGVVIANDLHPVCTKCMRGPLIKRGVKIGINVTLLPLITIGEDSLIGAGSVVTHNVPPRSVVYGNPARVIKKIDDLKCITGVVGKPYKS
jgi:acetyltransferase-like isoleucine patch superfamily enzyme